MSGEIPSPTGKQESIAGTPKGNKRVLASTTPHRHIDTVSVVPVNEDPEAYRAATEFLRTFLGDRLSIKFLADPDTRRQRLEAAEVNLKEITDPQVPPILAQRLLNGIARTRNAVLLEPSRLILMKLLEVHPIDPAILKKGYFEAIAILKSNPNPAAAYELEANETPTASKNVITLLNAGIDIARFFPTPKETISEMMSKFSGFGDFEPPLHILTTSLTETVNKITDYRNKRRAKKTELPLVPSNYDQSTEQRSNILSARLQNPKATVEDIADHFGYDPGLVKRHIGSLIDNHYLPVQQGRTASPQLTDLKDNLEGLLADGFDYGTIGAAFGMDSQAVSNARIRLGLQPKITPITAEDLEALDAAIRTLPIDSLTTDEELGQTYGGRVVSKDFISNRRRVLGLPRTAKKTNKSQLTDEVRQAIDTTILALPVDSQITDRQLAKDLGVSLSVISRARARLGKPRSAGKKTGSINPDL